MILTGGRVLAPGQPQATAVAVRDGRIVYVGDDAGARRAGAGADEIDLAGALCTPAFVDAHLHAVQTGQVMTGLDLHHAPSREDVLERVRRYVLDRPGCRVVVGQGWDERAWPDPRPPTRAELDRSAPGVAVYLARVDVHSAVVSSALLDQLPDVTGLAGHRDDGLLTREAHHRCRGRMDVLFTDAERRAAARAALTRAARLGVATVHELGGPHLGPLADLGRVRDVGHETGVNVVTYWGELASADAFARARSVGAVGLAGDLCIDGAIGSRTASLHRPYVGEDSVGARYLSDTEIGDHLIACTREGVQGGFHCIGDDAVSAAVEGLRRAARTVGPAAVRAARHRLEHVEMVDAADFATLADLGVVASVQPGFDAAWGGPDELYATRLGTRSATMNPFGALLRAGVSLALGTDAPVTPVAGWQTVSDAVHHWRPDQRLPVTLAFAAATVGGHRASRTPAAGTLVTGARADLAVFALDDDLVDPATGLPRMAPGDPLPDCRLTVAGGRVVFRAPGVGAG